MGTALRLLSGRAGGYLLAALVALAGGLAWRVHAAQLEAARAQLAAEQRLSAGLSRDIQAQNAGVAELEARAAAQADRLALAERAAANVRSRADARVAEALAAPAAGGCEAALDQLVERARAIDRRLAP